MIHADLHIHSHWSSDGEFEISDLVERCLKNDVRLFSVTDHNSVKGNLEASLLARQAKIDFIPGIEIDCVYQGINLHVLGYHIDYRSNDFVKLEEEVSSKVMDSFDFMIQNLHQLGFKVDADTVLAVAEGKEPTGELIAEVMLADEKYHTPLLLPYLPGGERSDMPYINFYLDYFAQGKPAYVPIEFMSFSEAIQLIKRNGGTPVVAHPGLNLKGNEPIVEELLNQGAEGLEVFNNYHSMEQIAYFASVVQHRKLLMTCGSDFHGKTKPLIEIGKFKFDTLYREYLMKSLQTLTIKSS